MYINKDYLYDNAVISFLTEFGDEILKNRRLCRSFLKVLPATDVNKFLSVVGTLIIF